MKLGFPEQDCDIVMYHFSQKYVILFRLVEIRRTSAFLTVITVPYRNTPYNTVQVRSV